MAKSLTTKSEHNDGESKLKFNADDDESVATGGAGNDMGSMLQ